MTALAELYEAGRGVGKDEKAAVEWYKKAAAREDHKAKLALKRLGKE